MPPGSRSDHTSQIMCEKKSQNENENGNIPLETLIPTAQHFSKNDYSTGR